MILRNRSSVRASLVVGAVLVPALLFVGRGPDRAPDAVINPSGASTPSDWRASSDTGRTSVSRVPVKGGPGGVTTAIEVRRDGGGGRWALALCGLRDARRFFQPGHTYRMQAYVRDVNS